MGVRERLIQLGIEPPQNDEGAIAFAENKTIEHIKNVCNIDYIPDELEYIAVDLACCEYINDKMADGLLKAFDAKGAVKALTEGDVSITYYENSHKSAMDTLLELLARGEKDLYRFRKMRW